MDIGAGISLFVMLINLVLILAIICAGVGVLAVLYRCYILLGLVIAEKREKINKPF